MLPLGCQLQILRDKYVVASHPEGLCCHNSIWQRACLCSKSSVHKQKHLVGIRLTLLCNVHTKKHRPTLWVYIYCIFFNGNVIRIMLSLIYNIHIICIICSVTIIRFFVYFSDLKESKELLEIIYLVLIAGNFLNAVRFKPENTNIFPIPYIYFVVVLIKRDSRR